MSWPYSDEKSREFYVAARDGDLPLVKSLSLDPEIDLNWDDRYGWTPFYYACEKGHVDIVRYLLDFHDNQRTIDHNLANNDGNTPFFCACNNGHEKVVEMLVADERIDLNRPGDHEETPLYFASYFGKVGVVKIMLSSSRQIDTLNKDLYGKTAADVAREQGARIKRDWESEEDFQRKKKGCQLIAPLIESYEKDPRAVRSQLRRELGYDERMAGELFALVVFLSDGYLKIHAETQGEENAHRRKKAQRFFHLASSLPFDLQMVLCNRVFRLGDSIVKKIHSEQGLKKFAREM